MKRWNKYLALMIFPILMACSISPEPINYGEDACDFCDMTIVSKAHAAQGVTDKGKQFKYDAIECLVNDVLKNNREFELKLVADFSAPGSMIPTENAQFIINDTINSPMGANLAAMKQLEEGEKDNFSWEELKKHFLGNEKVSINH